MQKYSVKITETFRMEVEIEAESKEDAEQKALDMLLSEEISFEGMCGESVFEADKIS